MEIYVAPPRGKKEKEACLFWLNHFGHEVIWLDLRRKVKGPLLLCGGADIGKDPERDKKEFIWIKQALDNGHKILGLCRGMQIQKESCSEVESEPDGFLKKCLKMHEKLSTSPRRR